MWDNPCIQCSEYNIPSLGSFKYRMVDVWLTLDHPPRWYEEHGTHKEKLADHSACRRVSCFHRSCGTLQFLILYQVTGGYIHYGL